MLEDKIKGTIRDVIDFPKQGIVFKDITPILENPELTSEITKAFVSKSEVLKPDAIIGIESRGFFWGLLIAQAMDIPFIPVRKKGKLPYKTISYKYDLEYGSAEIEMHEDALSKGMNVIVHDDLLATGGTAMAAAQLVKSQGANVVGFSFLVNLTFLDGEQKIAPFSNNIISLVNY
ncbi:adenine phosphoribosyltransferase [Acidiluteibacter ferrifornacis]|uniref:Adenine phosphoribosyltransferase n=1 Tax=Acidiluteibacter ferrifornacis TaxID=2692424 RepID=A0A6N9NIT2_9FLAO|nr:adenine phosphoribosyltransferase [Acidiluteibacter ferrifornacis]MBR9832621.1 adenine phosphoribosyltransferase [bacterium]NBG66596.1 adenine phosphoribosyltransferase [Acidiluteibacter ferrifornacis]